jgi:protein TonB
MFESVAPETVRPRSRRLLYETLPISIAAHAAAVAGILLATTWTVQFPSQTPRLLAMYTLEEAPPPPPPPPPPPAIQKNIPLSKVQAIATKPVEEVAPTVIPDAIPEVVTQINVPVAEIAQGVEGGVEGGVIGGVVEGVMGGVQGGEIGGVVADLGPPALPPDTVVIKRDDPLPTAPMSQVYPRYPDEMRIRGVEDMLVVRYIIGKDGRVRDVVVLSKPERQEFEKSTVSAIRKWRFRPYKKDGVAQEVIHELTIYFKLEA